MSIEVGIDDEILDDEVQPQGGDYYEPLSQRNATLFTARNIDLESSICESSVCSESTARSCMEEFRLYGKRAAIDRAFDELDDAWRLQRPQHVGLVAQAGRGLVVERHLQHPLVVSAIN